MEEIPIHIERLKNLVTSASTDLIIEQEQEEEYTALRRVILNNSKLNSLAPKFIKICSTLKEVKREMQDISSGYKGRRQHIKDQFSPLLESFYEMGSAGKQDNPDVIEIDQQAYMSMFRDNHNEQNRLKRIFISHSSKDATIVEQVIDLLEAIGVHHSQIFCTSFEGYGIDLGDDFLAAIKRELNNDVLVLFILSENFFSSPVSLCEMGATWVKTNEHIPILIPPFDYGDIRGVIPNTQGMKINDKLKLNSLKAQVEKFLSLTQVPTNVWERRRDKILIEINNLIEDRTELLKSSFTKTSLGDRENEVKNKSLFQDQHTFNRIIEILPPNGSIRFVRSFNFAGTSFKENDLEDFGKIVGMIEQEPWIEFFDEELESTKAKLIKHIKDFEKITALNMFSIEGSSVKYRIAERLKYEDPEEYRKITTNIHDLTDSIVDTYDQFIRLARRKLEVNI